MTILAKIKKKIINLLKKINNKSIVIYNKGKKYFAPRYVAELKKILKKKIDIRIISGQTDVALEVTQARKDINSILG